MTDYRLSVLFLWALALSVVLVLVRRPEPAVVRPEPGPLEVMPDAESMAELELGADGITRLRIRTWLDPACAKDFIVVLDGEDILRCRAMLPQDRTYLPRQRYQHQTSCAISNDDLRSGRRVVSDAAIWVTVDCPTPEKGAHQTWEPKRVNPRNVDAAMRRSSSC